MCVACVCGLFRRKEERKKMDQDLQTVIEETELDTDPDTYFKLTFDDQATLNKDVHVEIHKKIGQ